jgi:hypothetical protein
MRLILLGRNRRARRLKTNWVRLAWAPLALLLLAGPAASQVPEPVAPPSSHFAIRLLRDGAEIEFAGRIDWGASAALRRALLEAPEVRLIRLESPGGRLAEARLMNKLIAQRGLATMTTTFCHSACTIAYIAGKERRLGAEGRLGFHQSNRPFGVSEISDRIAREERERLVAAGVAKWFADKAYATPNDQLWIPTRAELLRARVVTQLGRDKTRPLTE